MKGGLLQTKTTETYFHKNIDKNPCLRHCSKTMPVKLLNLMSDSWFDLVYVVEERKRIEFVECVTIQFFLIEFYRICKILFLVIFIFRMTKNSGILQAL